MGFMLLALRPAAKSVFAPPERLALMAAAWKRFFPVVWVCIVALFITGTNMYTTSFRAMKEATGNGGVPLGWNLMLVLGLVMMAMFAYSYWGPFAKFKRAMAAQDWPSADRVASQVHSVVMVNFALGWLAIAAVHLVR